jgi:hypothetical protein
MNPAQSGDDKMTHDKPGVAIKNSMLCTAVVAARVPVLAPLERDVLLISRSDTRSSLRSSGLLAQVGKRLLGIAPPNRLADSRLEALRRFAILLRHKRERLPGAEEARLLEAGFTSEQLEDVLRLVARERPQCIATRFRRHYVALGCLVIAVETGLFRLCSAYLDNGMLGLVGALLPLVSATPLMRFFQRETQPVPAMA